MYKEKTVIISLLQEKVTQVSAKKSPKGSFLDYFLPLLGILQYYSLGSTGSYGSIILYIYGAFCILLAIGRRDLYVHRGLLIFVLYAVISQPILFGVYGGINTARVFNLLSLVYIFILLMFLSDRLNFEIFYRNYVVVGLVSSAFIVFQAFQLYILGQPVYGIALLPCDTSSWFDGGTRPCGLFPEPSVYAYYILFLLFLVLKKGNVKLGVLFSACIIVSTSTLGIVCCVLLWIWYLFFELKDIRKGVSYCLVIAVLFIVLFSSDITGIAFDKALNTDYGNSPRLVRGWFIFLNLDFWEQLFGIGFNNLQYYIDSGHVILTDQISVLVSYENRGYVTSVYQVLIGFGALGFVLYFTPFVKQLLTDKNNRILIFLFIILSVAQTMFFSMNFLMWILPMFNLMLKSDRGPFLKISAIQRLRS